MTAKPERTNKKDSAATKRNSNVPSVEKALDVLEALANAPDGLSLPEMLKQLDRTMGELYRVVVYLAQRGYIAQDSDNDRYSLTMRLFELANQHRPTSRLIKKALPYLERISYRTDQSCHLAVLHQDSVLVLASEPSPRHAGYAVRTGAIIPLKNTSSGPVIMAHLSSALRERFLSSFTSLERSQLSTRIEAISAQGYEERESSLVHGILNISVPVFDQSGIVAAITMGYMGQVDQRTSPDQARLELIAAAQQLSQGLGHQE